MRRLLKALRHDVPGPRGDGRAPRHRAGAANRWRRSSRPITSRTPASCRWRACGAARCRTARRSNGNARRRHRAGMQGQQHDEARRAPSRARWWRSAAWTRCRPAHVLTPSGKPRGAVDWPQRRRRCSRSRIDAENRADEVKLTGALAQAGRGGPLAVDRAQRRYPRARAVGPGRDPSADRARPAAKRKYNLPVKSAPRRRSLQGDDPPRRHAARAPQAPDRRPRPVRRRACARSSRCRAATGLRLRRQGRRRRHPAQLHPVGRGGRRATTCTRGPLGFPVVDVAVTLFDGQYHAVDSSDMAFKTAGAPRDARGHAEMRARCCSSRSARCRSPCPTSSPPQVQRPDLAAGAARSSASTRKAGWQGWDEVSAYLPQSELHDLIVELRSLTMGVGTFAWKFDHLQELTGRLADKVIGAAERRRARGRAAEPAFERLKIIARWKSGRRTRSAGTCGHGRVRTFLDRGTGRSPRSVAPAADSYTRYLKTQTSMERHRAASSTRGMMFEAQYTELALAVDLIAERIRAPRRPCLGSYAQYRAFLDQG